MTTRRSLLGVIAAIAGGNAPAVPHMVRGTAAQPNNSCREPRPSRSPGCPSPPRLQLRAASGKQQRGAIGTYCWADERGTGCCVDMIGPLYPSCPLIVEEGDTLVIPLDPVGRVTELSYTVQRDNASSDSTPEATDERTNRALFEGTVERPSSPLHLPADVAPGRYTIDLFAQVADRGDTSQGFLIEIRPAADGAATPPAAATPITAPEQ